ncbi:MAG: response regulator [Candidatus Omnitrophota bacterium]|nr:response regulator [Candidatus Omnitrophota bacterium]
MAKKILLIDDERTMLFLGSSRLKKSGYDVIVAENGAEGLVKAHSERPDIIVLDLIMPEMGGFDTLKRLKELNETRDIPVIVCSAKDRPDDLTLAKELGAVDYVVKPFEPIPFLEKIAKALAPA